MELLLIEKPKKWHAIIWNGKNNEDIKNFVLAHYPPGASCKIAEKMVGEFAFLSIGTYGDGNFTPNIIDLPRNGVLVLDHVLRQHNTWRAGQVYLKAFTGKDFEDRFEVEMVFNTPCEKQELESDE